LVQIKLIHWSKDAKRLIREYCQHDLWKPRAKHRFGATVRLLDPDDIEEKLEKRLGCLHARQRLGIEMDHEPQVFGQGLNFFHIENLLFTHTLIEGVLRLSGFYWQGWRNAAKLRLRHNQIVSSVSQRPLMASRSKILHLSDLHADI
jgi:hypothetical protein